MNQTTLQQKLLPRFTCLQEISSDEFGPIFEALDNNTKRTVHIHLYNDDGEDPQLKLYFIRRIRALNLLSSPHIISLLDYSEHAPVYMVVDKIEGKCITDIETVISQDQLWQIFIQLCLALDHIHSVGLVHREIKPENIYISNQGRVVITDLALVKSLQSMQVLGNTVAGQQTGIFGSPAYMSPEQLLGQPASPHSDIFSLGACLYYLCSGHSPFEADSLEEIIERVKYAQPVDLRTYNASYNPQLYALIDACLTKDPKERVPSAQALLSQLQTHYHPHGTKLLKALLDNEQIVQPKQKPKRNKNYTALYMRLVLLGIGLLIGASIYYIQMNAL